jgi:hypothetical protein
LRATQWASPMIQKPHHPSRAPSAQECPVHCFPTAHGARERMCPNPRPKLLPGLHCELSEEAQMAK